MLALAMWLASVSYSRDVAPILAMRCHGCHGEAGGFSTRTYASVMAGGNLGRLVVPGDPEASLLLHFVDGRRGEQRRMPMGGQPLTPAEIGVIKRWIAEGARDDRVELPVQRRRIVGVRLKPGGALAVTVRMPVEGFVTVRVVDGAGKVWFERVGAVKQQREEADAARPGELFVWEVRSGSGWPQRVSVELLVEYAVRTSAPELQVVER